MAFSYYSGTFTDAADLLAKVAALWEFDEETATSLTWGTMAFTADGNRVQFYHNGAATGYYAEFTSGSYQIVKTAKSLLVFDSASSGKEGFYVTIGKHTTGETGDVHVGGIVNASTVISYAALTEKLLRTNWGGVMAISATNAQVIPILLPTAGVITDSVCLTFIASSFDISGQYYINGKLYYMFRSITIKDE